MTMTPALTIQEQFEAFHDANPDVYDEFKRIAYELRVSKNHYGAKAIMEIVRYHRVLRNDPRDFKVNNNYTSRYARKLIEEDPTRFKNFFELRRLRSEEPTQEPTQEPMLPMEFDECVTDLGKDGEFDAVFKDECGDVEEEWLVDEE